MWEARSSRQSRQLVLIMEIDEQVSKLYVFQGLPPDYPGVLAFALTFSDDEAIKSIIKEYGGKPHDWMKIRVHDNIGLNPQRDLK